MLVTSKVKGGTYALPKPWPNSKKHTKCQFKQYFVSERIRYGSLTSCDWCSDKISNKQNLIRQCWLAKQFLQMVLKKTYPLLLEQKFKLEHSKALYRWIKQGGTYSLLKTACPAKKKQKVSHSRGEWEGGIQAVHLRTIDEHIHFQKMNHTVRKLRNIVTQKGIIVAKLTNCSH